MGKDEQPVKLIANYFSLGRTPQWNIFKYHVSFEPEVDMVGFRRALLAQHKEQIGGYLFDGMQIFVTHSLGDVLCLVSKSREGDEYHVTIKLTVAVDLASTEALQFLNLVQRGAMRNLGLVLVGRNYFDEIAKVFSTHKNIFLLTKLSYMPIAGENASLSDNYLARLYNIDPVS